MIGLMLVPAALGLGYLLGVRRSNRLWRRTMHALREMSPAKRAFGRCTRCLERVELMDVQVVTDDDVAAHLNEQRVLLKDDK